MTLPSLLTSCPSPIFSRDRESTLCVFLLFCQIKAALPAFKLSIYLFFFYLGFHSSIFMRVITYHTGKVETKDRSKSCGVPQSKSLPLMVYKESICRAGYWYRAKFCLFFKMEVWLLSVPYGTHCCQLNGNRRFCLFSFLDETDH